MHTAQERLTQVTEIRSTLGLNQTDFAKEIGMSVQAVNHWEQGRTYPSRRTHKQIIDRYEMKTINVENDPVKHPEHYTRSRIEVLDAIEEWELSYALGNVVKYCARADHKGNRLQDLCKAQFYLSREIEKMQKDRLEKNKEIKITGFNNKKAGKINGVEYQIRDGLFRSEDD